MPINFKTKRKKSRQSLSKKEVHQWLVEVNLHQYLATSSKNLYPNT